MTDHVDTPEKDRLEVEDLRAKLKWDRWIGHVIALISCLVLVIGLVAGGYQSRKSRALEFERRFWEKQLDVYTRLSAAAAEVAHVPPDSTQNIEKKYTAFAEIYYGEFTLFADDGARSSAMKFLTNAKAYEKGQVFQAPLLQLSKKLAEDLRESLSLSSVSPLRRPRER